ncbi:hypothetical protein PHYBLDRAFT_151287 [Phycomyces blakesleeanus NRRL 1555(-)]|uniref:Uncharacterized protein n=1 Tax=Phycomyces blakesleeanus (strain ATCC 8743b / DSM 1359 / FGSC 10004 / NBRC 33097 / NRRL 1555) TaxID=763407 RepID=A0A162N294_PHYB8|nr:hypothetical protein PHYBLDRAFT_151287 [Phycomyces blakesleeanus NRRL 1555(-)]OAD67758.1 hypothetical protein PHYBLDRAFT_151287 [Phycomyces blakesleeanus NRRL 1555(-)]|eukprot:XP_018285798.1 hypothetical protein PHYBLDRAFT_151287 [Phycomyces blakesleeanus NRRL 1555(-)]
MASIRKPTVRKECQCSISHEDTCNTISSAVSEPVNQEEDSFEFEQEDVEINSELRNNVQYTSDTYEEEEEYEDKSNVEMDNDEGSVAGLKRLARFEALTSGVKKYIAYSKCHAIYDNEAAPLHCTLPNFGKTSLCGNYLFKSGPRSKAPKKTYVFHSVKKALKTFFQCPDFENKINSWNRSPKMYSTLFDIYNGAMWNEIVDVDVISFVDTKQSLMHMLNIDWFQPFDDVTYSCGAIYLAINNIPHSEQFKKENMILVRLMSGLKEASTSDINNYLKSFVDELMELYKGIKIKTHQCPNGTSIKAALLIVACDIPAARKVCGFTSHTSTNACHKSERQRLEVAHDVCWSKLHCLQYFDIVCCTIIDPMHNLFLGTTKRMLER